MAGNVVLYLSLYLGAKWRIAATHFLGCLHLDEVQNFFKIASLEGRRRKLNIKVREANEYERALELRRLEISLTDSRRVAIFKLKVGRRLILSSVC
ncbi:hypothetical protein [Piscinibacter defluvii]|uniref:hypothetical protein n=1 Tax=Piscinibacter defluvii TaxID=1796922 RepID=UPI000FDF3624|nr:hypothetical protein [Piscinibacter defluvii]